MNYTLRSDLTMRFSMQFTSRIFSDEEPTSVALGITSDEFTYVFCSIMESCVLSGYSHASHSKFGDAVALNLPYDQFLQVKYNVLSKIEPMFSLFDTLKYTPAEKCLYVFSIASDGHGLASDLLQHMISEAKMSGFESILADCTNIKSQKLFTKFGFVTRAEVAYDCFEYNGRCLFKNISDTTSIKRMELLL